MGTLGAIHPFVPINQAEGYQKLIKTLEKDFTIIGFAGNFTSAKFGAQGEYVVLMVIRAYQKSIGQGHRNICLIPQSAHGTNPVCGDCWS